MDIELFKKRLYILYVLLPLIAIGIFCLRYNQNIFNYFLPNSQWNDEVIYYKTIEGITEYGIPQGYFGYNESRASIGTFGAWSPIIYVFDAIWGGVFGWNLYSPIIVRIVFACIGMLIYAALVRPNVRNSLFIWLFVISFSLYARYLSSQMADCYMVTLLVIYAGLYNRKEKKYKMAGRIVLILLTLLRPYYVLLWLPILDSSENEKYIIDKTPPDCSKIRFDSDITPKVWQNKTVKVKVIPHSDIAKWNFKNCFYQANSNSEVCKDDGKGFTGNVIKTLAGAKSKVFANTSYKDNGHVFGKITAYDKAGNSCSVNTSEYYVDKDAPVIKSKSITSRNSSYNSKDVVIKLTLTDRVDTTNNKIYYK